MGNDQSKARLDMQSRGARGGQSGSRRENGNSRTARRGTCTTMTPARSGAADSRTGASETVVRGTATGTPTRGQQTRRREDERSSRTKRKPVTKTKPPKEAAESGSGNTSDSEVADNLIAQLEQSELFKPGNDAYQKNDFTKAAQEFEKALENAKTVPEECLALQKLCEANYSLSNFKKCLEYADRCEKLAKENDEKESLANIYIAKGGVSERLGNAEDVLQCAQNILDLSPDLPSDLRKPYQQIAYNLMGNAQCNLSNYRKALEYHEKCLAIVVALGDVWGQCLQYGALGNVYCGLCDYRRAIEYHEREIELAKTFGDEVVENQMLSVPYTNAGSAYAKIGQHKKAREYFAKALEIALRNGDKFIEGRVYACIGDVERRRGNREVALENCTKALDILTEIGDKEGIALVHGYMGQLYYKIAEDNDTALNHLLRSLEFAKQTGDKKEQLVAYHRLHVVYERLGNKEEMEVCMKERCRLTAEINGQCTICLEEIGNVPERLQALPCSHVFHEECIRQWLRKATTCPECRTQVFAYIDDRVAPGVTALQAGDGLLL